MGQNNPFALIFLLRSITEKEPNNALAWRLRANEESELGDAKAALDAINHAVDLNACDNAARGQRAYIENRAGLNREAYDDLTFVIGQDDKNAGAHELRGSLLLQANEIMAALADFDAALEFGPPNVDLLLNRGGVLQELGRFPQAIADYDRGLRIKPGDIESLAARGYTRFFLQDFAGAAADLRPVAEINDNALSWLFLARSRLGEMGAAEDFARAAAQRSPQAWVRVVAAHFRDDKPDDDLLKTISDPEQRCYALFYLGEIALARKDAARAKQLFLTSTDACPIDPKRYSGSLREYVGAVEELKRLD